MRMQSTDGINIGYRKKTPIQSYLIRYRPLIGSEFKNIYRIGIGEMLIGTGRDRKHIIGNIFRYCV